MRLTSHTQFGISIIVMEAKMAWSGFQCLECGKKFRTVKAARRSADVGCPGCGGVDIDTTTAEEQKQLDAEQTAAELMANTQ